MSRVLVMCGGPVSGELVAVEHSPVVYAYDDPAPGQEFVQQRTYLVRKAVWDEGEPEDFTRNIRGRPRQWVWVGVDANTPAGYVEQAMGLVVLLASSAGGCLR